jgi:predicted anti-sigma-YlaC factor YlaD
MVTNPLTCQELVELVTDYLEDALPEAARARFEQHLDACQGCRNYLDQMRHTLRLTGRLAEATVPTYVQDQLLEIFRQWKEA